MKSRSTAKHAFHSADAPSKTSVNVGVFDGEPHEKVARMVGLSKTALQLGEELISSHAQLPRESRVSLSPEKCALTASALRQLGALVGEVQSSHLHGVKVAAALAGAVKLAQDGRIAVEDIFEVAQKQLQDGTVKVAALEAFDQPLGEVVTSGAMSTTPAHGGANGSGELPSDDLSVYLRSRRR